MKICVRRPRCATLLCVGSTCRMIMLRGTGRSLHSGMPGRTGRLRPGRTLPLAGTQLADPASIRPVYSISRGSRRCTSLGSIWLAKLGPRPPPRVRQADHGAAVLSADRTGRRETGSTAALATGDRRRRASVVRRGPVGPHLRVLAKQDPQPIDVALHLLRRARESDGGDGPPVFADRRGDCPVVVHC